VVVELFVVRVVGLFGGCWCGQGIRSVVPGLVVVSLSLLFVFCGVLVFPCVSVSLSFGGLGFWVVFVLLVLLRVALGLAFDGLLDELMVSVVVVVHVLGSPVQGVRGGHFASVSPCGGLGSCHVCPSSSLRIPNDLAATMAWGSEAD